MGPGGGARDGADPADRRAVHAGGGQVAVGSGAHGSFHAALRGRECPATGG